MSQVIRKVDGNQECADCGAADPDWASLTFGITLCIECSGIHRQMGVHISKVRLELIPFHIARISSPFLPPACESLLPTLNARPPMCCLLQVRSLTLDVRVWEPSVMQVSRQGLLVLLLGLHEICRGMRQT